jgi:hypothetical protein
MVLMIQKLVMLNWTGLGRKYYVPTEVSNWLLAGGTEQKYDWPS